jgi:hypothetical protein
MARGLSELFTDGFLIPDIDDRSIACALENVDRNGMQQSITIMKSSLPEIFAQALFEENDRKYVTLTPQMGIDLVDLLSTLRSLTSQI